MASNVLLDFNPNSLIISQGPNDIECVIEEVISVSEDEQRYEEMLRTPMLRKKESIMLFIFMKLAVINECV